MRISNMRACCSLATVKPRWRASSAPSRFDEDTKSSARTRYSSDSVNRTPVRSTISRRVLTNVRPSSMRLVRVRSCQHGTVEWQNKLSSTGIDTFNSELQQRNSLREPTLECHCPSAKGGRNWLVVVQTVIDRKGI